MADETGSRHEQTFDPYAECDRLADVSARMRDGMKRIEDEAKTDRVAAAITRATAVLGDDSGERR